MRQKHRENSRNKQVTSYSNLLSGDLSTSTDDLFKVRKSDISTYPHSKANLKNSQYITSSRKSKQPQKY